MHIPFDNSYAQLPERFYARLEPTPVAAPALVRVNDRLARLLGLDPDLRLSNLKGVISYLRAHDFAKWVDGLRKAGLREE